MEHYYIKTYSSTTDSANYLTVLNETDEGYIVRIVRDYDGYQDIQEEYMNRTLFESCIRTGYLTKMEGVTEKIAAIA